MSSLIDYIDGKEPPVNAPSCRNLDCLYNEDGKCTQGLACKQDETYEKEMVQTCVIKNQNNNFIN